MCLGCIHAGGCRQHALQSAAQSEPSVWHSACQPHPVVFLSAITSVLMGQLAMQTFQAGAAQQLPNPLRKAPLTCTALLNRCKAVLRDAGRKKLPADYIAGALSGLSIALNQCEVSQLNITGCCSGLQEPCIANLHAVC